MPGRNLREEPWNTEVQRDAETMDLFVCGVAFAVKVSTMILHKVLQQVIKPSGSHHQLNEHFPVSNTPPFFSSADFCSSPLIKETGGREAAAVVAAQHFPFLTNLCLSKI